MAENSDGNANNNSNNTTNLMCDRKRKRQDNDYNTFHLDTGVQQCGNETSTDSNIENQETFPIIITASVVQRAKRSHIDRGQYLCDMQHSDDTMSDSINDIEPHQGNGNDISSSSNNNNNSVKIIRKSQRLKNSMAPGFLDILPIWMSWLKCNECKSTQHNKTTLIPATEPPTTTTTKEKTEISIEKPMGTITCKNKNAFESLLKLRLVSKYCVYMDNMLNVLNVDEIFMHCVQHYDVNILQSFYTLSPWTLPHHTCGTGNVGYDNNDNSSSGSGSGSGSGNNNNTNTNTNVIKTTIPFRFDNAPNIKKVIINYGTAYNVVLMTRRPHFDPSFNTNRALQYAVYHNKSDIVEWLLRDPRVSLQCDYSLSSTQSLSMPNVTVAQKPPKYKLTMDRIFIYACERGYSRIVRLLIQHCPTLSLSVFNYLAITKAIMNTRLDVIQTIMRHPHLKTFDFNHHNSIALCDAAAFCRIDIVDYLMSRPEIDISRYVKSMLVALCAAMEDLCYLGDGDDEKYNNNMDSVIQTLILKCNNNSTMDTKLGGIFKHHQYYQQQQQQQQQQHFHGRNKRNSDDGDDDALLICHRDQKKKYASFLMFQYLYTLPTIQAQCGRQQFKFILSKTMQAGWHDAFIFLLTQMMSSGNSVDMSPLVNSRGFFTACRENDTEMIECVLRYVEPRYGFRNYSNCLRIAIEMDNSSVVKLLLRFRRIQEREQERYKKRQYSIANTTIVKHYDATTTGSGSSNNISSDNSINNDNNTMDLVIPPLLTPPPPPPPPSSLTKVEPINNGIVQGETLPLFKMPIFPPVPLENVDYTATATAITENNNGVGVDGGNDSDNTNTTNDIIQKSTQSHHSTFEIEQVSMKSVLEEKSALELNLQEFDDIADSVTNDTYPYISFENNNIIINNNNNNNNNGENTDINNNNNNNGIGGGGGNTPLINQFIEENLTFIEHSIEFSIEQCALYCAVQFDNIEIASVLMDYILCPEHLNPPHQQACFDTCFVAACCFGRSDMIGLLMNRYHINPTVEAQFSVNCLVHYNDVKHLARVLDDDRVNPLIENSSYFLKACKMGHCDIVRMFLERYYPPFHTISLYPDNDGSDSGDNHISSGDSAVSSPSSSMATTTATAAAKTFKYVLDPTIRRNKSIRLAAEHGHYKVVRLLIDYCQEIDPSDVCQQAFYYAIKNDHPKVVRELLKHPSIDPNDFVSNVNTKSVSPFMLASYLNNSEIMRILLKDSRLPAVSILRDLPRLFRHDNLSILKCILHHYDGKISTYIVCRKLQDYCDSAGNSPPEKICTYLNFTVRLSTQPNALL